MSRQLAYGLIVIAFIVGGIAGVLGYVWTVGGSGEPSQPISAPTLSLDETKDTPDVSGTALAQMAEDVAQANEGIAALSTQVAQLSEGDTEGIRELSTQIAQLSDQITGITMEQPATPEIQVVTITPELDPTLSPPMVTPAPTEEISTEGTSARTLFRIVSEQSEVRFTLDEVLRDVPTTVVGITDQVAGDVIVDFGSPANSEVGTIRINARTLATDNEFRNRALRSQILQSSEDAYEFIDFTPTALNGLPDSVAVGETVSFDIVGDLKVRNITHSVMFTAEITATSESELSGTASATVLRSDYDLQIPNVPGVADVTDEVLLEIDFVAQAVEQ